MAAARIARQNIEKVIAEVRKGREGSYDISQVMSFAELMIESVQTFLNTYDNAVYNEIREIGQYISKAKGEIGNLRASDLQENHIPSAGRELDEIVKSTENATNTIMESAEKMMEIEADSLESYQEQINEHVMIIFEACSFQDITGQRINKVVHTLQYIDNRIAHFSKAFGIGDEDCVQNEDIALTEEEAEYERRKKDLILHGPALDGEGTDQDAVDALLDVADFSIEEPETTDAQAKTAPESVVSEPKVSKQEAPVEEKPPVAKEDKKPAPKKEAPAAKKEPAAPKKEDVAPKKETPAAKKEAAAPKKEAPAAKKEPVAAPKKEAPAAKKEPVAAPKKEAPAAKKEAAAPKKEAPAPAEASDEDDGNSQADIDALFD